MSTFGTNDIRTNRKILVAVDFGTTSTGVAWAETSTPNNRTVIETWPDGEGFDKVPTILEHDGTKVRWGFQVDDSPGDDATRRYEWFKLGLDPDQERKTDLAKRYPNPNDTSLLGNSELCERLVVQYLTAVRKHIEKVLKEHYTEVSDTVYQSSSKEYIITVPAVWSDAAKAKTLSCAEKAGMIGEHRSRIISEPEAAAIHALDVMDSKRIEINDTFVVCDAGGGTVDCISYTVKDLLSNPLSNKKLLPQLDEAATGSGQLCGGTFVNRIFAEHIRAKYGRSARWNELNDRWDVQNDKWQEFMFTAVEDFEAKVKRNFKGDTSMPYTVRGTGSAGRIGLSGQDVKNMFDPVIKEIIKLVKSQIQATSRTVKAVLLVGGFGRSPYLRKRLQEAVGETIQVIKVDDSWTAVVRGALLSGLAEMSPTFPTIVESRKARRHYGIRCYTAYDPNVHKNPPEIDSAGYAGGLRVLVMKWFIEKGSLVKESDPSPFQFYWEDKVSRGRPGRINIPIYCCEDTVAPMYEDKSVAEFLKLTLDPKDLLEQVHGENNEMYYMLDVEVEMTIHSADIEFALKHGGTRYDTAKKVFK